jgi:hypothetical protein
MAWKEAEEFTEVELASYCTNALVEVGVVEDDASEGQQHRYLVLHHLDSDGLEPCSAN